MANLIDYTYFIGELNIPNADNESVTSRINYFVTKYQDEILNNILGYRLSKRLLNESSTAITELKNGAEYTDDDGNTQKWAGILENSNTSLIANFVFVKYITDASNEFSGSSFYVPNAGDRVLFSPSQKCLTAWNTMSDKVYNMVCFLLSNDKKANYTDYNSQLASYALFLTKPLNSFDI